MIIGGLQKLTLLDYPGKLACTVFTVGCNFKCPFCHNSSLVFNDRELEPLSAEELVRFLKKRSGVLEGVCITGGEPLLNRDIEPLISKIKELGYCVKLDTNGSFPDRLKGLVENGLIDKVAMDIKNSKRSYAETVGIKDFDIAPICESVDFLLSDRVDYEFRTTVTQNLHSPEDFEEIGEWIKGAKAYFLQDFKDSGDLICPDIKGVTPEIIREYLATVRKYVPCAELRGIQ